MRRSAKTDCKIERCAMKPRDPNRSDSARAMGASSVDEVTESLVAGDGTVKIVAATYVFPTVGAN